VANALAVTAPSAATVAAQIRVTGLLHDASGRGGQALINGKLVRVGETVDDYMLRAVEEASIVVGCRGRTYRVRVAAP
jgi:hypothetical protein